MANFGQINSWYWYLKQMAGLFVSFGRKSTVRYGFCVYFNDLNIWNKLQM